MRARHERSSSAPPARAAAHARPSQAWAGAAWKGAALVALICLLNGIRRAIRDADIQPPLEVLSNTIAMSAQSLLIAVPVSLAAVLTWNRAPPHSRLRWLVPIVAVSFLAGLGAFVFAEVLMNCDVPAACWLSPRTCEPPSGCWRGPDEIFIPLQRYGLLSALFIAAFVFIRLADESAGRAAEAERNRARFAQREEEARLRMLQAQIEPHFLFNTLANVRRLYRTDPAAGEAMLGNLLRYLAVALPQMRATTSTLAGEAALAESFLEIQRTRMGTRLAFEFDIPAALRDAALPPMMLLTLVENAIKHGLAPLPEGGAVRIGAVAEGAQLVLRVADTGRGFVQSSGGGTGLANIRARLASMYGAGARLALAVNTPRGVIATIALPLSVNLSTVSPR